MSLGCNSVKRQSIANCRSRFFHILCARIGFPSAPEREAGIDQSTPPTPYAGMRSFAVRTTMATAIQFGGVGHCGELGWSGAALNADPHHSADGPAVSANGCGSSSCFRPLLVGCMSIVVSPVGGSCLRLCAVNAVRCPGAGRLPRCPRIMTSGFDCSDTGISGVEHEGLPPPPLRVG